MAAARSRKKPPQKRVTEKQQKQQQRRQQQQQKAAPKQAKYPPKTFVPKAPQKLGQGKLPLHTEANKKATFTQQCVLATQGGQQRCFLSNCITSQATAGTHSLPPATVWPPVARWVITTCPQQLGAPPQAPVVGWAAAECPQPRGAFPCSLWQDGQAPLRSPHREPSLRSKRDDVPATVSVPVSQPRSLLAEHPTLSPGAGTRRGEEEKKWPAREKSHHPPGERPAIAV